jgi:hypothetical protein
MAFSTEGSFKCHIYFDTDLGLYGLIWRTGPHVPPQDSNLYIIKLTTGPCMQLSTFDVFTNFADHAAEVDRLEFFDDILVESEWSLYFVIHS